MPINMRIVRNDMGEALSFPDFEDGSRLKELAQSIANALDTIAFRPVGSPLERLVGFVGYPEQFALWWDGFTCELGCSAVCGVNMDEIADRLVASKAFTIA
jgi:hypothetical protein